MDHTSQLLNTARQQITFNQKEMTQIIYGNPEIYHSMMQFQQKLNSIPEARNDSNYFNLSRKQQILGSLPKLQAVNNNFDVSNLNNFVAAVIYFQSVMPASVSYLMALPAIQYLGSEEQKSKWIPKFYSQEIIGCYAQTELGHGSDIQNLETTATYDSNTDEFIIHTPSVSATKFWPGELGLLANYALVYAKLIINGKNKGVLPFMVQIRSMDTHKPLEGIIVGDIGPKLGYSTKDNGFLAFNNFRVPVSSMMSRYVRMEKGHFSRHGNEKISYASMMFVRNLITLIYPRIAAQSITIAIRYSIVRQQFTNDKKQENSVIEYQTQQDKLLPRLAQCYGLILVGLKVKSLVEDNFIRVQKKDFSLLQQTHAILAASKAWSTQWVIDTTEWCRLSCGGHGYAHYSGLPGIFFDAAPNVTLEGENQVLHLQVARYILKLEKHPERATEYFKFEEDKNELYNLIRLNVLTTLDVVKNKLMQNISEGFYKAWNKTGVYLLELSQRYAEFFIMLTFKEKINQINDDSVKQVMIALCDLFCLQSLLDNPQRLIENDQLNQEQYKNLVELKSQLLPRIKREAIGLVDAFEYSDSTLKTCIGCYDGMPYEKIYKWAVEDNLLNKQITPSNSPVQLLKNMKIKANL